MPCVILKRLSASEVPWLRGSRTAGRGGPRWEVGDLEALLGAPPEDGTVVRVRWYDGERAVEETRSITRTERSCRLAGRPLGGKRLRRLVAGDVVLTTATPVEDVTGEDRWLFTLDGWVGAERGHPETITLLSSLLNGSVAAAVQGDVAEPALLLARRQLPAFGGGRSWEVENLSDHEWAAARAWLTRYVRVPALRQLLEAWSGAQIAPILDLLGAADEQPKRAELAEAVLRRYEDELLADPRRRAILKAERFREGGVAPADPGTWRRGGLSARRFARRLGLPTVMAGATVAPTPVQEDFVGLPPLGRLHDYQRQLAIGIRDALLSEDPDNRRAIVWLPTGTGKTRVLAETLLMETCLVPPRNVLVWVADREELCEQAIAAFRHVWLVRGHRSPSARSLAAPNLRVIRMWGGRVWREPPSYPTLVVASIQTLAQRVERRAFARHLAQLGAAAAAVVFDEAHHVVAPSYGRVLRALGLSPEPNALGRSQADGPPLFGLTATPARRRRDETEALAERFHGRLLEPEDPYRSMRGYIRRGYLARPRLVVVRTGYVLDCLQEEDEDWRTTGALPEGTLERAGRNPARSAVILRDLEPRLEELRSVLVFACSVEHAETMAEALSRRGVRAAALHGRSPHAYRQSVLRRFRDRSLTVLVSCDLVTTGFDAPNVDAVVLARPVESRVLFAQMVGRGLRGPRNGGTPECLLLDYEDNLGPFGSLEGLRASFRASFVGEDGEEDRD